MSSVQQGRSLLLEVFCWAAVNLAPPGVRRDRHWFDLGVGLYRAGEWLQQRIDEADGEDGEIGSAESSVTPAAG
ncbi:hypothetical protein ACFY7Y_00785 [Streptomyces virginiae]|uniref:hypothetical protein n=1 Tax=Streptomyces virginiae TaxID=1961 RepID=UPI0036901FD1